MAGEGLRIDYRRWIDAGVYDANWCAVSRAYAESTVLVRFRNVGSTGGTPVLAVERDFVLLPKEWVAARVNGLRSDRMMGIRMTAFVFAEANLYALVR